MTTIWGQQKATTGTMSRDGSAIEIAKFPSGTQGLKASHAEILSAQERTDSRQEILSEIVASLMIPLGD